MVRFHDLRHTAASLLLKMNVSPKMVQEILGHSDIEMTLGIYSHVLPGMHGEAMEKMDQLFNNLIEDNAKAMQKMDQLFNNIISDAPEGEGKGKAE